MRKYIINNTFGGLALCLGLGLAASCTDRDTLVIDEPVVSPVEEPAKRNVKTLSFAFPDYPEVDQIWLKDEYIDAELAVGTFEGESGDVTLAENNGLADGRSSGTEEEIIESYTLSVKGRGNSTWGMPKKPMRLKFKKKTELCGLRNAKNFVLLANYIDPTHMRNVVAFWLANRLGMPYSNQFEPCNVYINGKYTGLFLLTNKVGINSGSVDIDEERGILFELSTEFDEPYKFRSAKYDLPVMVKDPDFDELADSKAPELRLADWQRDFEWAEALAADGRAAEAFDIESAVNYMLVMEICGNSEIAHPKSWYMYKEEIGEGSKYVLGPIWDFDAAFNNVYVDGTTLINNPERSIPTNALLRKIIATEEYTELYARRFEEFRTQIWPELQEFVGEYSQLVAHAAEMDGQRWNIAEPLQDWTYHFPSTNYETHVRELMNWLGRKMAYLDKKYQDGR